MRSIVLEIVTFQQLTCVVQLVYDLRNIDYTKCSLKLELNYAHRTNNNVNWQTKLSRAGKTL